jgi:hypothetical protein
VGSLAASNYDFTNLVDGTLTIEAPLLQDSSTASSSLPLITAQASALLVAQVVNDAALRAPTTVLTGLALPVPPGPPPDISIAPSPTVIAAPDTALPMLVDPFPAMTDTVTPVVEGLPLANSSAETPDLENVDKKDEPAASAGLRSIATPSLQGEQVTNLRTAELGTAASVNVAASTPEVSGVLAITILRENNEKPTIAGVAFEQKADTLNLRTVAAPTLPFASEQLVVTDKLTTFMVSNSNGTMVEFQGSLVNKRLVIIAPSNAAKLVAQSDINAVLTAAVISLSRESRVMLTQLDSVVLDLR